jgi:hypothetical protein
MTDQHAIASGECSRAGVVLMVCALLQAGYAGLCLLSGGYNALTTIFGLSITVASAQSAEEALLMGGFYAVFGGIRFIQTLFDLLMFVPIGVTLFGSSQLMRMGNYTWATRGMQAVVVAPVMGLVSAAASILMINCCGMGFGFIINAVLLILAVPAAMMASDALGRDYVIAAFGESFDDAL